MAWSTSDRRQRLPRDWKQRRTIVLIRDRRRCQLRYTVCTVVATQVDHIRHGDDHAISNLQAVCRDCHLLKSASEGHNAKPTRRRPAEPHPGLIDKP